MSSSRDYLAAALSWRVIDRSRAYLALADEEPCWLAECAGRDRHALRP